MGRSREIYGQLMSLLELTVRRSTPTPTPALPLTRLLRLARVLKLVRALPQLQIIVQA